MRTIRFDPSTEAVVLTAVKDFFHHGMPTPAGHQTWHSVTRPRIGEDVHEGDFWVALDETYPRHEVVFFPEYQAAEVVPRPGPAA